eukprot:TRINITY_DN14980_c0_g7_i2.p1 TRINITY_DN14980_c0_g7~~TRINITY_DN14980_c0_g7_i2.p1  ORF type:complete len:245 (-),score=61.07 TRINITY_DN14980_c0_g7_i2:65-799(-)
MAPPVLRRPSGAAGPARTVASQRKSKVVKSKAKLAKGAKLDATQLAQLVLGRPQSGPSTKTVAADVPALRRYLGRPCPHFGKKGVVQLAAGKKYAASPLRFNKYAGWAEFRNAVLLWVNAAGGSFTNTFTSGGKRVTWYVGGPNPTTSSPIVRRLLEIFGDKASLKEKATQVMLMVRRCATEPYVVCGAVDYVSHDAAKTGFEFVWELRDFTKLKQAESFRELLDAAASPSGAAGASTARRRWA